MMYLILGEYDWSLLPKDPEERKKIMAPIMEIGKKDIDSGEIKIVGYSPDGRNVFVVSTQDLKTIYSRIQVQLPYAKCKVMPMLSYDEFMDVMKEMQP